MQQAPDDWAGLIAAVEAEREAGTDPADPKLQPLLDRWQALIRAFTGGDPGITASLKRMYSEQGAAQASRGAMSAELQEYVGRAMAARGAQAVSASQASQSARRSAASSRVRPA